MNLARAVRASRLSLIVMAAVLVIAGLLVSASQLASAHTATPRGAGGLKPTIVLEHGAWADGSSWDAVATRLQLLGFTVDVPLEELGSKVILPPKLEPYRDQIEPLLTPLPDPRATWAAPAQK